jgi:hypothetical protein
MMREPILVGHDGRTLPLSPAERQVNMLHEIIEALPLRWLALRVVDGRQNCGQFGLRLCLCDLGRSPQFAGLAFSVLPPSRDPFTANLL